MTTRYPKSGKGRKWTVAEIRAIPREWGGDTLSDGDGLSGEVRVGHDGGIAVRWKYAFRWEDKTCWFQAGTWPTFSLDTIRARRDVARSLKSQGINPNTQKAADRITLQREAESVIEEHAERKAQQLTVADMFDEWIQHGLRRVDGNAEMRRSFEKDVLPAIGAMPVSLVSDSDLRNVLKALVDRGVDRTAVLTSANLKQMFAWSEKRQPWRRLLADGNPADLLEIKKVVADDYEISNVRNRVLSGPELQELRDKFNELAAAYAETPEGEKYSVPRPVKASSQLAIWICLGTLSRIGETMMAEWSHVDLDARTWSIPKENVKGARGKKQSHTVYLSDFSLALFKELHKHSGTSRWLFPSKTSNGRHHTDIKTVTKQMTDRQEQFTERTVMLKGRRQDNTLVLSGGANGNWTPHDMRRTGSTMMQALGIPSDVIDRCQNHVLAGGMVRRAYQHHIFAAETKAAWQQLGKQLDSILSAPLQR